MSNVRGQNLLSLSTCLGVFRMFPWVCFVNVSIWYKCWVANKVIIARYALTSLDIILILCLKWIVYCSFSIWYKCWVDNSKVHVSKFNTLMSLVLEICDSKSASMYKCWVANKVIIVGYVLTSLISDTLCFGDLI